MNSACGQFHIVDTKTITLAFSDYDEGTVKLLKVPVPLNIRRTDK
ncbi:MAG: hypothetical protein ACYSU4_07460 [Planctomycetota bacterium]|jgi:hypothetical protein